MIVEGNVVRVLPAEDRRVETGPVQFGDEDWPGVFIRGDHAMFFAGALNVVLADRSESMSPMEVKMLDGLRNLLMSCVVKPETIKGDPG